jgi:L-fucose isomerase-like protein
VTTCAVIVTGRNTFLMDLARSVRHQCLLALRELRADVVGPEDLVTTPEEAKAAARLIHEHGQVDLQILICGTFSDAWVAKAAYGEGSGPVLIWAFRDPAPAGFRTWQNSFCGANLAAYALVAAGRTVRLVYGWPGEAGVRDRLEAALNGRFTTATALPGPADGELASEADVRSALATMRGRSIGLLGDPPPGFTPSYADPDGLFKLFGLKLQSWPLPAAFEAIESISQGDREAEADAFTRVAPSLTLLRRDEVELSGAITQAFRAWCRQTQVDALAVRCWPEFPTELGVCPCSSLGRVYDEGLAVTACERDVNGAVTMMLLKALGSGPNYLVDAVDLDADANIVRLWHCGSAPNVLADNPSAAIHTLHCNRQVGVAGNFALKHGQVTIARLGTSRDGFRLLVSGGECLSEPNRFQGNTAAVRLDSDAERFINDLVEHGWEHHTVLAWGDFRPELRQAGRLLDLPVHEW